MNSVLLLGLNHETAPLAIRERLALSLPEQDALLRGLIDRGLVDESAVLVTCNRVELYVAADRLPSTDELAARLVEGRDLEPGDVLAHAYLERGGDVASHLFHVAAGLDSMVLGETQVLGQLRDAYERAQRWGTTGPRLDPLMQRAIACGREVAGRSGLARLRSSVASVAVEHAERLLGGLQGKTVLCVGAGKIGGIAMRKLADRNPARLVVANRDRRRGEAMAARLGAASIGLEQLEPAIAEADLVLSSTGAPVPLISRRLCERSLRIRTGGRPLLLVDLALPRDVEPAVADLPGVTLLNIDDLQHVAREQALPRQPAIDAARRIVASHLADYDNWQRQRSLGPVIDKLYRRSHALAEQEVERALADFPGISEAEREHWRALARRVVNQLLHLPVRKLGESECPLSSAEAYLRALEHLFSLDADGAPDANAEYGVEREAGHANRGR